MSDISLIRINLKPDSLNRYDLINDCLKNDLNNQYVAIGWSYVYTDDGKLDSPKEFKDYEEYYKEVVKSIKIRKKRVNHALNVFWDVKENDLFWTRDLNGFYWICRAKSPAEPKYVKEWDVGARVPVKAYQVGLDVPGQIKASFNRPNGGTVDDSFDSLMKNYSKHVYNMYETDERYKYNDITYTEGCILNNLQEKDLEELVISYIQLEKGYYLLSNSIANKSTTISIECSFISRDKEHPQKAVVQVKAKQEIVPSDYEEFLEKGYEVFFYDGGITKDIPGYVYISKEELLNFYNENKIILPESITRWEKLFV